MEIALLLTEELKAQLPENIKIYHTFGFTTVVDHKNGNQLVKGDHCILKCENAEVFLKWVKEISEPGLWMTEGHPQLEHFVFYKKSDFKTSK